MTKEDIINKQATKLRIKHQFNELTELECKHFVSEVINEALNLYGIGERFSPKESTHVLNKPKTKYISKDLKNILEKHYNYVLDSEKDIEFINKYAGKKTLVYEWSDDWWITEDDNYPITKECFSDIK